ncbi:parvalbumin alpha [Eurytemora carolleeae]|uniref:parvalbumin alpha n=1 Tax=Eurytemora carolleeae TaxID=1294199 RepID=UPI000C7831D0|nr:parvalbumin alpha [Eurytemora carolleeae]|eukprot:XP_023329126.1 parvalbumin alpha-like [Eurytemora affinis]
MEPNLKLDLKLNEYLQKGETVLNFEEFIEVLETVKSLGWSKFENDKNESTISDLDMRGIFKMVDVDKSGTISRTELKMACKYLGKRYGINDAGTWQGLMRAADSDGDGKLSYAEFKQIIQMAENSIRVKNLKK